jgi:hypothetical protein
MGWPVQPLLVFSGLAYWYKLIQQIEFLKVKNEMPRMTNSELALQGALCWSSTIASFRYEPPTS